MLHFVSKIGSKSLYDGSRNVVLPLATGLFHPIVVAENIKLNSNHAANFLFINNLA